MVSYSRLKNNKILFKLSSHLLISILISMVSSFSLFAAEHQTNENLKKAVVLQDLAYGNILFEYYRDKPINALNAILIAEKKKLLPNHQQSARLLSGVIYLDLGMISHAQKIFSELLSEDDLKSELLSRLEFYLSKIQYRQGDYQQAEIQLAKIVDFLEPTLKDEALLMLSHMAIQNNQKEKARNWLSSVSQDSKLLSFSRYNLLVSYLRDANLEQALIMVNQLTQQNSFDFEDNKNNDFQNNLAIQDKARVALGYFYLTEKNYPKARESLINVRLNSIESNKALLGMGWSYLGEGHHQKALSHWLELISKDNRDLAVQEALLAVPYAYQQLDAQQEALDAYLQASTIYQHQINLINELLIEIEKNDLIEKSLTKLSSNKTSDSLSQGIYDSSFFGEKLSYYLFELLSQHQFNQSVISYQQLQELSGMLLFWKKQLPLFSEMLNVNKQRFAEKIPLVDLALSIDPNEQYKNRLTELEKDISDLKNNRRLFLLSTDDELKHHHRVTELINRISSLPQELITHEQRVKALRAKDVLQWHLESNKTEKIWQLEKTAKQIKLMLIELDNRKNTLLNARETAKYRFSGFQDKIIVGSDNLLDLSQKLDLEIKNSIAQLKLKVINILIERKILLENFILQSDLEVARMHGQSVIIPELN